MRNDGRSLEAYSGAGKGCFTEQLAIAMMIEADG